MSADSQSGCGIALPGAHSPAVFVASIFTTVFYGRPSSDGSSSSTWHPVYTVYRPVSYSMANIFGSLAPRSNASATMSHVGMRRMCRGSSLHKFIKRHLFRRFRVNSSPPPPGFSFLAFLYFRSTSSSPAASTCRTSTISFWNSFGSTIASVFEKEFASLFR